MENKEIAVEDLGAVAILRLSNGVTNAISPSLVEALSLALKRINVTHGGAVLAGGSKFFSIGLDLPGLLSLTRPQMKEFWYAFDRAVLELFTFPLPTACAVCGHAVAGGTILALACDYRFAASGRKLMGLSEIRLGLPVPYLADLMLRQVAGDRAATKLLFFGELVESDTAGSLGLVDGVFPEGDVEKIAVEKIAQLAENPKKAFSAIKANRVEEVRERFEKHYREKTESLLDLWFSPGVQELLEKAAQKF